MLRKSSRLFNEHYHLRATALVIANKFRGLELLFKNKYDRIIKNGKNLPTVKLRNVFQVIHKCGSNKNRKLRNFEIKQNLYHCIILNYLIKLTYIKIN